MSMWRPPLGLLLPDCPLTEDAFDVYKDWEGLPVRFWSLTWIARNEGRLKKSMRSLQVYFLCSVTWLARNKGRLQKSMRPLEVHTVVDLLPDLYEKRILWKVCGFWELPLLFCYLTSTKRILLWKVWGLWMLTVLFCYWTCTKRRMSWRVWGICKSTVFVLLPDWYETEDALKKMRSLEACLLLYFLTEDALQRMESLGSTGVLLPYWNQTEEAFGDCQDPHGLT